MPRLLASLILLVILGVPLEAAERCSAYTVVGSRAESVPLGIVADVNGDGSPDIVSPSSVFFGMTAEVKTGPISAVAKRSPTGPRDLLRITQNQPSVFSLEALRVTPDGTITVRSTPLQGATSILAVGDFNGDGIDDVVLHDQIRFGTADGTFVSGPALPIVIPFGYSVDIGVGDFDGDHHLDLAIRPNYTDLPNVYPPLTIYSGDGKGNFHVSRTVVPQYVQGVLPILVADVDGDGVDDLILNDWLGVDILPSRPGAVPQRLEARYFRALTTGDFNGDGKPDLAAITQDSDSSPDDLLGVWLNDGTGRMKLVWQTKVRPLPDLTGGAISSMMFARDVDRDGKDDLVMAPYDGSPAGAVLYSRGDGSFSGLPAIAAAFSYWGAAGDFDGDGDDDVVLASYDNVQPPVYKTVVFWNDGNGAFHTTTSPLHVTGVPKVADVDGDGKAELLQRGDGNSVSVLRITPDGALIKLFDVTGDPGNPNARILDFAAGHFTGAGTEIALVEAAIPGSQVKVEIFDGHAPASPRFSAMLPAALPFSLSFLVAASDLNGDGRDDLILAGQGQSSGLHDFSPTLNGYVLALLSTATLFQPADLYHSTGGLGVLAAGDFNGDGIGDVAFTENGYSANGAGVTIYFGDHNRQFHSQTFPIRLPNFFTALTVSDLDGDGADDIVTSDKDTLELLFGSRTGVGRLQTYLATGDTMGVFAVRNHPGGVPWLFGSANYPGALLWSPKCDRARAARH